MYVCTVCSSSSNLAVIAEEPWSFEFHNIADTNNMLVVELMLVMRTVRVQCIRTCLWFEPQPGGVRFRVEIPYTL